MSEREANAEMVKCVLVGDNAVGKTRLVCARACRQKVSLSQLLNTHVPTVWAIDQYRIYKEVLDNSMMVLDGISVSLRLWDTFGDHHKDRRFAYGRADVVLMCYDVGRMSTLENCRDMWYHQIRRFCPNTPIILVGCKNDVRFILNDLQYLNYCRERSPLVRQVRETDLVLPEVGRRVAKDLGVPYFETSVLTYFGVNEVFENATRAALVARRQQRFWMTNLKKVSIPDLQEPFCPPKPNLPGVSVVPSSVAEDFERLYSRQDFTDVILLCGTVGFSAHRFVLAAASPFFLRLFTSDAATPTFTGVGGQTNKFENNILTRSNSETSLLSCSIGSSTPFFVSDNDTDCLLSSEHSTPARRGPRKAQQQQFNKQQQYELCPPSWIRPPASQHQYNNNGGGGQRRKSFHASSPSIGHWRRGRSSEAATAGGQQQPIESARIDTVSKTLNHPVIKSVKMVNCESLDTRDRVVTSLQIVLECNSAICPKILNQIVKLVYTGELDPSLNCDFKEMKRVAGLLELSNVETLLHKLETTTLSTVADDGEAADIIIEAAATKSSNPSDLRKKARDAYFEKLLGQMEDVCLKRGLFSDISFRLDEDCPNQNPHLTGEPSSPPFSRERVAKAHKAALMARCDVMAAMFSHDDFVESSARVIKFPGVSGQTFHEFLRFVYGDRMPCVNVPRGQCSPVDEDQGGGNGCVGILELADRLCLPRLRSLAERRVVTVMTDAYDSGEDVTADALKILQPCQIHNADQLADWCLAYLAQNYNSICRRFPKVLRTLFPENQAWLNIHRWPPIWYLKDFDFYQRMVIDRDRETRYANLKRPRGSVATSGCLCFSKTKREY